MKLSTRTERWSAFTLIEVLMAMTIFALVITAIYATWTIILKSRKIGADAVAQVQRERITMQTIEQALMSARSFGADIDRYAFEVQNGDSGSVSFVAQLPDSFPRSGKFWPYDVRRVTFQIEPGQNYSERDLVLRQNPLLMDLDEDEEKHPLVLARNVQQMLFEFWDGRKNEWSDSWAQSNTLPRLVRFTVAFARPNGKNTYSHQKDEITRLVGIPTGTVPQAWQGGRPAVGTGNQIMNPNPVVDPIRR